MIEETYPALPTERAYFGHSLGGGFGLATLFRYPGLFNRYIISSPGLSYAGDDYALRAARHDLSAGAPLPEQLFMTVGDREEFEPGFEQLQLVSSFYRLTSLFNQAKRPNFDFTSKIFSGETHVSVWPVAFSHRIRALFGTAEHPA